MGGGICVFTRGRGLQIIMCVTEKVSLDSESHVINERKGRSGNLATFSVCVYRHISYV